MIYEYRKPDQLRHRKYKSMHDAFLARLPHKPIGSCWEWKGGIEKDGYGLFSWYFSTSKRTTVRAHRMAYQFKHGAIPDGACVCHKCDNRACCNPDHLFIGSQSDNMSDCVKKGRHPVQILTSDDVLNIRKEYVGRGGPMQKDIAAKYGVSQCCISDIIRGWRWKHI